MGEQFRDAELFSHKFLKSNFQGSLFYIFFEIRKNFGTLRDKVQDADLFHKGIKVVVCSLLGQGWVLLKDILVDPWGVFVGLSHLKFSFIHFRNI